jgi:hypothetical protein
LNQFVVGAISHFKNNLAGAVFQFLRRDARGMCHLFGNGTDQFLFSWLGMSKITFKTSGLATFSRKNMAESSNFALYYYSMYISLGRGWI